MKNRALKCLDRLSAGKQGMLTGYILPRPTSAMTAEAAFARMLLGEPLNAARLQEASGKLIGDLPSRTGLNYYYFYYGSLALMQMQGMDWRTWNACMSRLLVDLQEKQGALAGSWTPDKMHGSTGGRVYTTAMATLTLEVYYRYLPMYAGDR